MGVVVLPSTQWTTPSYTTRQVARHAIRVSLIIPLVMLALVMLLSAVPALIFAYPLVLLLLLAVGPLAAVATGTVRQATWAGLLAGAVSALLAALVLAAGVHLLGEPRWSFVFPATRPPVPPLPRPQVIPFLSWPLHYLLLLQPLLAALLAAAHASFFGPQARLAARLEHLTAALPATVRTKMMALLLVHAGLTAAVGWLSFSAIEELHLRGHMFQLEAHWRQHVDELSRVIDAQQGVLDRSLQTGDPDPATRLTSARQEFAAIIAHLRSSPLHPELSVGRPMMAAAATRYEPLLAGLVTGEAALQSARGAAEVNQRALELRGSLSALAEALTRDELRALNETDLAHHNVLFAIMALIMLTTSSGLLFGRVAAQAITRPLGLVAGHLTLLGGGNFTGRIWVANRDELGALVTKVNDVTAELDRLYRQEQQGREAAEALAARERALTKAKEFLVQTIVHDLKQPIAVLAGYVELLRNGRVGPLPPRQVEVVGELTTAIQRLEALANDIVDTFRLEQEALPLELTEEDPVDLLHAARATVVGPSCRAPELVFGPALRPVVVDRRLMLRVIGNLITNAYQHAGPGTRVWLSARLLPANQVLFQIEDDGPGVPPDEREHIFEPFAQGRGARAGSGLGLAFTKLVVERHGGRIWVDDAACGGARFNVVLPSTVAERNLIVAAGGTVAALAC